ncbi:hypothetical protein PLESTM_001891500 [Pleodorina starrii]|nr:hypothetical protein PLESTM_001891500 [Pleodorina starrii]
MLCRAQHIMPGWCSLQLPPPLILGSNIIIITIQQRQQCQRRPVVWQQRSDPDPAQDPVQSPRRDLGLQVHSHPGLSRDGRSMYQLRSAAIRG